MMRIGVDAASVSAGTSGEGHAAPWDRHAPGWSCATHMRLTRERIKEGSAPS